MAIPRRVNVALLPRGHEFPPATFQVSPEGIARYLEAVDDEWEGYSRFAPPLGLAALALRALLEHLELPAGSLHAGQEVECREPVALDADLVMTGRVAQRSERGGFVASVIEFEVAPAGAPDRPALIGRTTVMAPRPEEG